MNNKVWVALLAAAALLTSGSVLAEEGDQGAPAAQGPGPGYAEEQLPPQDDFVPYEDDAFVPYEEDEYYDDLPPYEEDEFYADQPRHRFHPRQQMMAPGMGAGGYMPVPGGMMMPAPGMMQMPGPGMMQMPCPGMMSQLPAPRGGYMAGPGFGPGAGGPACPNAGRHMRAPGRGPAPAPAAGPETGPQQPDFMQGGPGRQPEPQMQPRAHHPEPEHGPAGMLPQGGPGAQPAGGPQQPAPEGLAGGAPRHGPAGAAAFGPRGPQAGPAGQHGGPGMPDGRSGASRLAGSMNPAQCGILDFNAPRGFEGSSALGIAEVLEQTGAEKPVMVAGKLTAKLGDMQYELTDPKGDTIPVLLDSRLNWSFISRDMPIELLVKVDKVEDKASLKVLCARTLPAQGPKGKPGPEGKPAHEGKPAPAKGGHPEGKQPPKKK